MTHLALARRQGPRPRDAHEVDEIFSIILTAYRNAGGRDLPEERIYETVENKIER